MAKTLLESTDRQFKYSRKKDKAIPFFSASSVGDTKTLFDFGIREILVSYFYIRKALKFYEDWLPKFKKAGGIFMTDSGAFSFMGSAYTDEMEKPEFWTDYRKEYIDWCIAHKDYIFSMVNLDLDDIVGRDVVFEWNKKYFEPIEHKGIQVIYVAHESDYDKGAISEFTYYCKKYRYVGINQTMKKYASKYYNIANHYHTRVHGFAWTEIPILRRFPFFSCDSTSWLTGMRFGTTFIDDGKNFRSLDSKHKYLRKTHKLKYEKAGIDVNDIKAEQRDAIQNMNLLGWRAFVREYIKVADIKLWNREVSYYEK